MSKKAMAVGFLFGLVSLLSCVVGWLRETPWLISVFLMVFFGLCCLTALVIEAFFEEQ